MRIAFYAPMKPPDHPVPSGDRRVARLLLSAMRRAGHQVRIASRFRAFDKRGDGQRQNRIRRRGDQLARQFLDKHRADPPDLWFSYHLYHKAPDWLGPPVSSTLAIPYVVAEASVAPRQADGPWSVGHDAVCHAVRCADRILLLNPDDADCLTPLLDRPRRLVSMPPFIDTRPPRRAAALRTRHRAELAAQLAIESDDIWIAVTAMMRDGDKLESYQLLGRAKRRLSGLPIRWLVAGDGPARGAVETALGSDDVHYLGAIEPARIDALHAAADIAVWPAIHEAFGMALLEAQAAGLPVVAGDMPGVAQIVRDGESGLLTPCGDDRMLADAVRRLAEAPDLRAAMGIAAMRKAEHEHDIAGASSRIDRVLRDALERRNP